MGQQRLRVIALMSKAVGGQVEVQAVVAFHYNSTHFVKGSEVRQCLVWLTPTYGTVQPHQSCV